ncbi:hypothetical protein GCM10009757_18080 [Streptomyces cheonanensis]|uniref:Uncharacterized protein n=1 Tax=Streptomyces cheonanensis TaxID=312720 RepID=A0ABN2V157_9ACTN
MCVEGIPAAQEALHGEPSRDRIDRRRLFVRLWLLLRLPERRLLPVRRLLTAVPAGTEPQHSVF